MKTLCNGVKKKLILSNEADMAFIGQSSWFVSETFFTNGANEAINVGHRDSYIPQRGNPYFLSGCLVN